MGAMYGRHRVWDESDEDLRVERGQGGKKTSPSVTRSQALVITAAFSQIQPNSVIGLVSIPCGGTYAEFAEQLG